MNASRTPAQRIVSLLPSATEIVYALGLGDRLVGVTHECDYPPQARAKLRLTASALPPAASSAEIDRHVRASLHAGSSLYSLDADALERLAPDLIITQELCDVCAVSYDVVARATKRLRGDPRLISLEPGSLEDVFANIATVAELTGTGTAATELLERLRTRVAALRARAAALTGERKRVLVLEWPDPPFCGGHWTPGLIELAGGESVLGNAGVNSTVVTWEQIAAADPDIVIVAPCGYSLPVALQAARELRAEPAWTALRAVRDGSAYALDGNAYVNRPGPRLVDTAELFHGIIAGEVIGAGGLDPQAVRAIGLEATRA